MSERNKSGTWLSSVSSVVGNISGLWSRSGGDVPNTQSSQRSSTFSSFMEEQPDPDLDSSADADEFMDASSAPLPSAYGSFERSNRGRKMSPFGKSSARYLSPSVLTSHQSRISRYENDGTAAPSRKRPSNWDERQEEEQSNDLGAEGRSDDVGTLYGVNGGSLKRICLLKDDLTTRFNQAEPPASERFFARDSAKCFPRDLERSFTRNSERSFVRGFERSFARDSSPFTFTTPISVNESPHPLRRISRPPSSTSSSLSNKTKNILSYLETVANSRTSGICKMSSQRSEKWSEAVNSPPRLPPRTSVQSLPRAHMITKALTTVTQKPLWSLPARYAYSSPSNFGRSASNSDSAAFHSTSAVVAEPDDSVDFATEPISNGKKQRERALSGTEVVIVKANKGGFAVKVSDGDVVSKKAPNGDYEVVESSSPDTDGCTAAAAEPKTPGSCLFSFAVPVKRGPRHDSTTDDASKKDSRDTEENSDDDNEESFDVVITVDDTCDADEGDQASVDNEVVKPVTTSTHESPKKPATSDTEADVVVTESPKKNGIAIEKQKESESRSETTAVSPQKNWTCPTCFVPNKADAQKCVCCSTNCPSSSNNLSSGNGTLKPWSCKECFVPNSAQSKECIACGASKEPKTDAQTDGISKTSANVFGSKAFKPLANATGISFGFGLSNGTASAASQSLPKPSEVSSKNAASLASSEGTTSGFSFGIASGSAETAKSEEIKKAEASTSDVDSVACTVKLPPSSSSTLEVPSKQPPSFSVTPVFGTAAAVATDSSAKTQASMGFNFSTTKPLFSGATLPAPQTTQSSFGFGTSASTPSLLSFGAKATTTAEAARSQATTFGSTVSQGASTAPSFNFSFKGGLFGQNAQSNTASEAKPIFGTSVEMGSPEQSPPPPVASNPSGFNFASIQSQPSSGLFSFGAPSLTSSSTATGSLFNSNSSTTLGGAGTTGFQFGAGANTASADKTSTESTNIFGASAPMPASASAFNFGSAPANANPTNFVFGASAPPASFSFGPQSGSSSVSFGFSGAADAFGAQNAPNYFSAGSTPSARRYLKAKRTRK